MGDYDRLLAIRAGSASKVVSFNIRTPASSNIRHDQRLRVETRRSNRTNAYKVQSAKYGVSRPTSAAMNPVTQARI